MNPQDNNNQTQPDAEGPAQAPATPTQNLYQPATDEQEEAAEEQPVTWQAQEYIHLSKGIGWFVVFALIALALIAADFFFLRSWTFSVLVVVMSIAVIVYVRRPPRTIQYTLSPKQGLYIGEKLYTWEEFKAFGIINDHGHYSLMLVPVKRFAPGVSVYFPEDIGEDLVDMLAQRLPMEELKLDAVDMLIRKLRF